MIEAGHRRRRGPRSWTRGVAPGRAEASSWRAYPVVQAVTRLNQELAHAGRFSQVPGAIKHKSQRREPTHG